MHLSEEDLILHYYRELDNNAGAESHLASCPQCRAEFSRLQQVLRFVDEQHVPDPGLGFERHMWARIQSVLPARSPRPWWMPTFPQVAFASGLAVLLVAAFVAGRSSSPVPVVPASDVLSATNERVLLIAVVDHLDRSEMVLVELMNGDADALDISGEQSRARELVAENRLYRQTATQTGDDAIGEVLEELERALLEIANAPDNATASDLAMLRARIETRGLLFKVRVVHSEMRERERQTVLAGGQS